MTQVLGRILAGKKGAQASGVLLAASGVFLVLSLTTYSSQDYPNSSRLPAEVANWGGQLGSYLAYIALTAIGYAAYLLPVAVLLLARNRLRQQPVRRTLVHCAGLLGMGVLFSIGMGLPTFSSHTAFQLGGWVGTEVSSTLLIPYLGRIGAAIVLLALFLVAVIGATDLEAKTFLQKVNWCGRQLQLAGTLAWRGPRALAAWMGRKRQSARARREEKRRQRQERQRLEQEAKAQTETEETAPAVESLSQGVAFSHEETAEQTAPEESPSMVAPDVEITATPTVPFELLAASEPAAEPQVPSAAASASEPQIKPPVAPKESPSAKKEVPATAPPAPKPEAAKKRPRAGRYRKPAFKLLDPAPDAQGQMDRETLLENARILEQALANFDVSGKVVEVSPGPVVTRYEVEPASGVKVGKIVALSDDLARVMSAQGIRIQAPVPGKSVVGIEIANHRRETVYLREILEAKTFRKSEEKLTMALGKTIDGEPYVADLARMPHLLVAGATGAGKSVCINCLISSLLFRATPDEVRLLMIDPKVVELTIYNEIPHLLVPVITEPKKASEALKWAVAEMEARYQKLARLGVRNLADYNRRLEKVNQEAAADGLEPEKALPYIVVFIDEFADLMLTAPADVETSLMSLAQKSRAVGIHIILATQRPSVNVITGVIKANFPSRIAFQVASKTDSRTILDFNGAERLLGRGDMLFLPGGQGEPLRIHGAFISGEETEKLVEEIKACGYEAEDVAVFGDHADINAAAAERDELFDEAVQVVVEHQQASTSFLQRRMKVGYSRAARLMDDLEDAGIVGPAEGAKPRQIYIDADEMEGGAQARQAVAGS